LIGYPHILALFFAHNHPNFLCSTAISEASTAVVFPKYDPLENGRNNVYKQGGDMTGFSDLTCFFHESQVRKPSFVSELHGFFVGAAKKTRWLNKHVFF